MRPSALLPQAGRCHTVPGTSVPKAFVNRSPRSPHSPLPRRYRQPPRCHGDGLALSQRRPLFFSLHLQPPPPQSPPRGPGTAKPRAALAPWGWWHARHSLGMPWATCSLTWPARRQAGLGNTISPYPPGQTRSEEQQRERCQAGQERSSWRGHAARRRGLRCPPVLKKNHHGSLLAQPWQREGSRVLAKH